MKKVSIVRDFDKRRELRRDTFGEKEKGSIVTNQIVNSTGEATLDFWRGATGAIVIISQRQQVSVYVEVESKKKKGVRFLKDTYRNERLCTFDFSEIASNPKAGMHALLVARGAQNICDYYLIGPGAEEFCWDIIWWLIRNRWAKCGKAIARAYPEWWEWQCNVFPELKKKKV